jgi:O-antigen ligase
MRNSFLLLGLLGLFLGWNMPNHYPLWTTFHGEVAAAWGVCLLFVGTSWPGLPPARLAGLDGGGRPAGRVRVAMPMAARAWMLLALVPPLQYLAGQLDYYGDALLGLLYALGAAMSVYIGSVWAAQAGRSNVLRAVFLTVVWAGLASAGIAYWQWVGLPPSGWWAMELIGSRPFGNFAQPNLFGLLMVMGVIAATALFEMRVLLHRVSYYLVLLFFGCAMLVGESRASGFAMLSVAGFWLCTQRRVPSRLRWYEVLAALAAGWLVQSALPSIEQALYLKAAVGRSVLDVGPREAIWLHFWAAIRERPWFGYGFGQGVLALREVATQVQPSRNTIYAHNFVLDLMTWVGIPLGLGLSAALGAWMLSWLRKGADSELMAQRHWVFAIWLAMVVQSLLEFPYAHVFFLLPAALLAGTITAAEGARGVQPHALRSVYPSRPALALGTLVIGLLALTTWDYLQFESEFRANRFDIGHFASPAVHEIRSGPVMLDQLEALNASAHYQIVAGMPAHELERLGRIARRFHLLPSRMDFAKALALNGQMADAQAELHMIRGVYHPLQWAQIERDWLNWQEQHQAELHPAR